ncbi:MAG TPA: formylglycine-generating enzyme family protein [Verrucomicrobiae bacterium]|jgi:formylglycine-generating enzyme required for sulfatase activity
MRLNLTFAMSLCGVVALLLGCDKNPPPTAVPTTTTAAATQEAPASKPPSDSPADMVRISGGHFVMGDKTEIDAPPHEVTVSPFYMDKNLVDQDHFQKVVGSNPSRWKAGKNPVEQVRWSDAVKYCNQRSQLENLQPCYDLKTWKCDFSANGYRLPTEAEWECACRAGTSTAYFFGDTPAKLGDYAWIDANSGGHPHPVGQKLPNPWGLYDMCGNVWEWCNDFYKVDYYKSSPAQDPKGPDASQTKVVRGGAWRFSAENCRSGYRYNENPGYADVCFGYDIYGFRCVRSASAQVALGAGEH